MFIPNKIKHMCNKLDDHKYQVYVVGGCVRDFLMSNKTPHDFDLVTNAKPDKIAEIFNDGNHKVKEDIGESFKITIVDDVEIATFRKDTYFGLDAKNATIEYADTLEEDLERRDFTMNSIAYDIKNKTFIDPFKGESDIKNGIIRFTGDPKKRVYEDPCRIIRACRFLALNKNMKLSPLTEITLVELNHCYKYIAPERIRLEILKAMECEVPSKFFGMLQQIGILKFILCPLSDCYNLSGGKYHNEDVITHCLLCGDFLSPDNPLLRLAGYLHDVGKPYAAYEDNGNTTFLDHENIGASVTNIALEKLKFSKSEIKYITDLIKFHMRQSWTTASPKTIRRLLRHFNDSGVDYHDHIKLKEADRFANLSKPNFTKEEVEDALAYIKKVDEESRLPVKSKRNLAIDGNDVMNILGIKPGKLVGKVLDDLTDMVDEYPNMNNPLHLTMHLNFMKGVYNENRI